MTSGPRDGHWTRDRTHRRTTEEGDKGDTGKETRNGEQLVGDVVTRIVSSRSRSRGTRRRKGPQDTSYIYPNLKLYGCPLNVADIKHESVRDPHNQKSQTKYHKVPWNTRTHTGRCNHPVGSLTMLPTDLGKEMSNRTGTLVDLQTEELVTGYTGSSNRNRI